MARAAESVCYIPCFTHRSPLHYLLIEKQHISQQHDTAGKREAREKRRQGMRYCCRLVKFQFIGLPRVVGVHHVAIRGRRPVRVQLEVEQTQVVVFVHLFSVSSERRNGGMTRNGTERSVKRETDRSVMMAVGQGHVMSEFAGEEQVLQLTGENTSNRSEARTRDRVGTSPRNQSGKYRRRRLSSIHALCFLFVLLDG